jgi:TrmH family RNA methyltransferase
LPADYEYDHLYVSEAFAAAHPEAKNLILTPTPQIEAVSTFKSNNAGIAVVKQKRFFTPEKYEGVVLILDSIRDPGNLGTIIRLADWYGIKHLVCSEDTVEFYNPKVISSTMGSFTRVDIHYTALTPFLKDYPHPIYGADLEGENVHNHRFPENLALVIGSESHGILPECSYSHRYTFGQYFQEHLTAAVSFLYRSPKSVLVQIGVVKVLHKMPHDVGCTSIFEVCRYI